MDSIKPDSEAKLECADRGNSTPVVRELSPEDLKWVSGGAATPSLLAFPFIQ